jgi:restriction system protein
MELYIEIFVGALLLLSLFLKSSNIIKFGKYKGTKYTDLSDDYLLWLTVNTSGASKKLANKELIIRKSIIKENLLKHPPTQNDLEDMKSDGDDFEKKVAAIYEEKGYSVEYHGLELEHKDSGIDLIAKKNNKIILIQCKFLEKEDSITHNMVKEFYGNCNFYIDKEKLSRKKTICLYAVPSHNSISKKDGTYKIFEDNHKKCRYEVFE